MRVMDSASLLVFSAACTLFWLAAGSDEPVHKAHATSPLHRHSQFSHFIAPVLHVQQVDAA